MNGQPFSEPSGKVIGILKACVPCNLGYGKFPCFECGIGEFKPAFVNQGSQVQPRLIAYLAVERTQIFSNELGKFARGFYDLGQTGKSTAYFAGEGMDPRIRFIPLVEAIVEDCKKSEHPGGHRRRLVMPQVRGFDRSMKVFLDFG